MDELTDELAALRAEHVAWSKAHRIVEAQANQDRHTQFVALVTQMYDPNLGHDERLLLRSQIAAELRRLIDSAIAQDDTITIKFKPTTHQQIELRLVKQTVESLTVWSRSANAADYPQNPMRRLIAFPRSMLVDPATVPAELFAAYTAGGA